MSGEKKPMAERIAPFNATFAAWLPTDWCVWDVLGVVIDLQRMTLVFWAMYDRDGYRTDVGHRFDVSLHAIVDGLDPADCAHAFWCGLFKRRIPMVEIPKPMIDVMTILRRAKSGDAKR